MVHIERVDLTSRQVIFPNERVGMVIAQPFLSLSPTEPYRCTLETKAQQLAVLADTLTVSRACPHGAPKTHFTVFPEYSIPGMDGIQYIDNALAATEWPIGKDLRPTDYFSQSQQQTLLLGLFLTACSSQTWSAFSPVFLDDPVTHFDDLNTYAFLDLIVGLLQSEIGRQQFILSTCDEKLFHLARQKFRHLGERAVFYRFSAIGADGPAIESVGTS